MTTELPDEPLSRKESYLAAIAGEDVVLPDAPESRTEQYLAYIAENGGGGGGGTTNFNQLTNRPKYNSTTMTGSTNIPKVPTKTSELSNDSNFVTSGSLATVATTGSYSDLTSTPTIPTVNDATLTITQNGVSAGTFTANDSDDTTIALTDTTYSNFTGTDGTAAGAAGLVPAPATTDAGKFLKADGTWDSAGGGGGVTVVQTPGTSTTSVMSQNAATSMVFADPANQYQVQIGSNAVVSTNMEAVAIGYSGRAEAYGAVGIMGAATGNKALALGPGSQAKARGSIAFPASSTNTAGVMALGVSETADGYNSSNYRLITGVHDGQSAHDVATKGQLDSIAIQNAGEPTTSTVGSVGQLLEDTTNGKLYQCASTSGGSYTWTELGVARVLTSADYNWNSVAEDDVTEPFDSIAVWLLPAGQYTYGSDDIGRNHMKYGKDDYISQFDDHVKPIMRNGFIIFYNATSDDKRVIAFNDGTGDTTLEIDDSTRLFIYGLNDQGAAFLVPQLANVAQIAPLTGSSAPTTSTTGTVGKIYIDSTNEDAYICVVADDTIPSYTWKKITP